MANTFKNSALASVGTSAGTLYTAPSSTTATIIGLTVANITMTPITIGIYLTISGSDFYIIKNAVIPVGGALVPIGGEQKVVLEAGDAIKVISNSASSADVIVSVLEIN
jgi:hypothetical protein